MPPAGMTGFPHGPPRPLNLIELRDALTQVLDQVASKFGAEIAVEDDYYWHLSVDSAFDLTREPDQFTVGLLSEGMDLVTQVDELRAGASRVETVFPDGGAGDVFDANALAPSTRPQAAQGGYDQGRDLAEQLAEIWR